MLKVIITIIYIYQLLKLSKFDGIKLNTYTSINKQKIGSLYRPQLIEIWTNSNIKALYQH